MNTRLVMSLAIVSLLWGSVTPAWPQVTGDGLRSPSGQCNGRPDYAYGEPIAATAPLLKDLFEGTAHFVPLEEAESVEVDLPKPPVLGVFDQKLPIIRDPQTGTYLAFTRGLVHDPPQIYNIFMLESIDGGKTFRAVSDGLFPLGPGQTYLEPHIAIDTSVCPRRYVMTLECPGTRWASTCVSFSTTPSVPASWSTPVRVVEGCNNAVSGGCTQGKFNSASTSVSLIDGNRKYVSWTEVSTRNMYSVDDSASTKAIEVADLGQPQGFVDQFPHAYLLEPERNVNCRLSWDCNNKDKQDWKKEGAYFYLMYNGAGFWGCDPNPPPNPANPPVDPAIQTRNSIWGLSIARSASALGPYDQSLPLGARIMSGRSETCGVTYPVINAINGELYLYYAGRTNVGGAHVVGDPFTRRSKLVWGKPPDPPAALSVADSYAPIVRRAYQLLLDREPDLAGLAGWLDFLRTGVGVGALRLGHDKRDLLTAITESAEFQNLEHPATLSDEGYIALLYRRLLKRLPSAAEASFYLDYLLTGASRQAIFEQFIFSPEFLRFEAMVAPHTGTPSPLPNPDGTLATVRDAFQVILKRAADSASVKAWSAFLRAGNSRADLLANLYGSPEFESSFQVAAKSADAFVAFLYQHLLNRAASSTEVSAWSQYLSWGASKLALFMNFVYSAEFKALHP